MHHAVSSAAQALTRNGFEVYTAATAQQARELVLSLIQPGQSVGLGGSMTIRELGVIEALKERGHVVSGHWLTPEERVKACEDARLSDVYLASSNAVTLDGQLVNIDGSCNRVGAMAYAPGTLLLVVGQNKLVDGGIQAAVARIKACACPPNARRLGLNTPCAQTGHCNVSECGDDCMCHVTSIMSRPPRGRKVVIVLVEESLGY